MSNAQVVKLAESGAPAAISAREPYAHLMVYQNPAALK
jgi:hypothetical protein